MAHDSGDGLVTRVPLQLAPDPARVVTQLFVAGEEVVTGFSRATTVMRRALALPDDEVEVLLASVLERFSDRHIDLVAGLLSHFEQIGDRIEGVAELSTTRRMLLGAYATSEYAVEAAALCNPSIVQHPDQSGLSPGELRFVLSLRAIGEGHRSSIELRTGVVDLDGTIAVDTPDPRTSTGTLLPGRYERHAFAAVLADGGAVAALVLDYLPATFSEAELEVSIAGVRPHVLGRRVARDVLDDIRNAARSNYSVVYPPTTSLDQRVLRPRGPSESNGMEDARFVRFVDDDGAVRYHATYTAFDGSHIAPQLVTTVDFRTFTVSQFAGRAATNKGMALFPRRIRGRYVALSRWDRECNAVATSADGVTWDDVDAIQSPGQPWELVQVGNCGSPIETPEGWLVITHGVGPMRTYCLGALLLDLDDPQVVRGRLSRPLLEPLGPERDGYVPNVVYSCGALVHGTSLVLPYAYGDRVTTFALVDLAGLVARLLGH